MPTICSPCVTPVSRPSRSNNGWPSGWPPGGLVFNDDKTQITHLDLGVGFLGFTIRRYPNGKLLTKPSNDALRRIRKRLSVEVKALRGSNADTVIAKLNPI